MVFNTPVTKVEFVGGKYLLALSEDSGAQLCNLDDMKVRKFSEHQGSVRNAAVDP